MQIQLTLNGTVRQLDVPDHTLLVNVIREHCGLTGTHHGEFSPWPR